MKHDIGIVGLAVMGRSLALNFADHGYEVSGFNRSYEVTKHMEQTWKHERFTGYQTMKEFVESLSSPKNIVLMVKAGETVDIVLRQLLPFLVEGDRVFDGGNSFFQDTIRREKMLKENGILFFGVGISGGETGARFGPSIMVGGNQEAYESVRLMFENIAAVASDGTPCCTYVGENGAGHFVKMVHNGIEYADMQIITEAYLLLKHLGHLNNKEMAAVFREFDQRELNSYLIHITGSIMDETDEMADGYLLDNIRDSASQKGTGKWTSEEALRQGVDVSLITSAYHARIQSSNKLRASLHLPKSKEVQSYEDVATLKKQIEEGMYVAKIIAYAQGFNLLYEAGRTYQWKLSLREIASIFRAGCIIQARLLNDLMKAYDKNQHLSHLLLDTSVFHEIGAKHLSLRQITSQAILSSIPVPTLSNAVAYIDGLTTPHVGANLIQAQRDYFGAHTYERVDREGSFHHEWGKQE